MKDRGTPQLGWWQALNPAIYLISILPGIGVWVLLHPERQAFIFLAAATLAVALLQHAINLFNDVADWRLGADMEKWDSWVRYHGEDARAANRHGWISFLAGGLLGLVVLASSGRFWIIAIALPLVGLGYLYNAGKKPLSYSRKGEWATGLCYGPGVFGCLWLVAGGGLEPPIVFGSIAFACLSTALLFSHQPPQILTDRLAGKQSFAARHGEANTYRMVRILFFGFLLSWALAVAETHIPGLVMGLLFSALAFIRVCSDKPNPKNLLLSVSLLFIVLILAWLISVF